MCSSGVTIGSFSQVCGGAPGGSGPLAPAAPAPSDCVHDPGNDLANRLCHFFESAGKFFEVFCFSGGASVLAAAAIGLLTALFPGAALGLDEELWASMSEACDLVETYKLDVAFGSASTICGAWDTAISE